jgi:TonB-dependent receptor
MNYQIKTKKLSLALAIAAALSSLSGSALAQDNETKIGKEEVEIEVIEVTGIRSALASALAEKRSAGSLKEVIKAEDIGKLPDNNLAEVLENVTGVQITRENGVGSGVQIRGTDSNRVEINGVSTVGSGTGRSGVNFTDIPAALISSVEVIKVPEAKTIEGSVGGTINLSTLRGLSLKKRVASVNIKGEHSDLAQSTTPRVSATFGDNWETNLGRFGLVMTGSYAEQDVASFSPRYDRDRVNVANSDNASSEDFSFLKTQYFVQHLLRQEYETKNLSTSLEFEPNDNTNFYLDLTVNDQVQSQRTSNLPISGSGGTHIADSTVNTAFQTIDLGTIDGPNGPLVLGEIKAVSHGILGVGVSGNAIDPNLRSETSAGARQTKGNVFAFGGKWNGDKMRISAELSYSDSESRNPELRSVLDFINPNGPQPSETLGKDNGVPIEFDVTGSMVQFGIAQGQEYTPSTAELLDPANYALRYIGNSKTSRDNSDTAFRVDVNYDVSDMVPFFTDVDVGFRWNETTSAGSFETIGTSFGNLQYRPRADLFASVVSPGPDNYDDADGRTLFIEHYLMVDKDLAFENPEQVINAINDGITANNATQIANGNLTAETAYGTLAAPNVTSSAFSDISEATSALYLQGNFETELGGIFVTGNIGARYIQSDISSLGNEIIDGVTTLKETKGSYDYFLPRLNIAAEVTDKILVRAGIAKDIRRPDFGQTASSINFGRGADTITTGNPNLKPETVVSYDLSADYYMSDSTFFSVGVFHKERKDLHETVIDNALEVIGSDGQGEREIDPACSGGGIWNPNVLDRGVYSPIPGQGLCVGLSTPFNVEGGETQTGIEFAVQHDLAAYEESLGWASGFGFIANYTYQEAGGGIDAFNNGTGDANALNILLDRHDGNNSDGPNGEGVFYTETLDDDFVQERVTLLNLSENAYNFTLFYEKYGLSVRTRYTWRSAYKTESKNSFDLPGILGARGQFNVSASYDFTDNVTVGIEGVNLLRSDATKWCVNEDTLMCSQGLTDRRITAGITARF